MNRIHCTLLTPESKVLEDDFEMTTIPALHGEMGVMLHHEKMIVQLVAGEMRTYSGHVVKKYSVTEGFAHITGNACIVMVKQCSEM